MLYNPQFKTFLTVASAGSFTKAAALLYITPTAVIKQINLLEEDLSVTLFLRTHRGLVLTAAGESLRRDAKELLRFSAEAAARAQSAMAGTAVLRVGTSPMTPADILLRLRPRLASRFPGLKFRLIPFENTPKNARDILASLGKDIDLVPGLYDDAFLESRKCAAFPLGTEPLCLAVPISHPLAEKEALTMADLSGETLLLIRRGWNAAIDRLRDDLLAGHPEISVEDFDFYRTEVFNRCENEGALLLTIRAWKKVHPLLKILPVRWDYTVPFGLLHAPNPAPPVRRLLDALKESGESEE